MTYDTISFLTDWGTVDESVGVVKSVIRSIAPSAAVIDLTHEIPPFDIRTASIVLARSANYLVPGVVLAVVDPGVGSNRKAIAVEVGGGESILVGPDNGLLAPIVAIAGGATRAVELVNQKYQLSSVGNNFHGRDVFGPVAAHLCNGVELTDLGPPIEPHTLVPATLPFSEEREGALYADVVYVDRFGNLHLNVEPEQIESYGPTLRVTINGKDHSVSRKDTYGHTSTGQALVMVDEVGMISIAVTQAPANEYFNAENGSPVEIRPSR